MTTPTPRADVLRRIAEASRNFTIVRYRYVNQTGGKPTTDEDMDAATRELLAATEEAFAALTVAHPEPLDVERLARALQVSSPAKRIEDYVLALLREMRGDRGQRGRWRHPRPPRRPRPGMSDILALILLPAYLVASIAAVVYWIVAALLHGGEEA